MAEASEQSSGGLVKSNGQSLPLRSLVVEGDVKGYILGLQARLSYENDDKDPLEVMFRMPLESTQAVVGLTALVDGRKIIAELQEKEEARTAYDDAIAGGQTSAERLFVFEIQILFLSYNLTSLVFSKFILDFHFTLNFP